MSTQKYLAKSLLLVAAWCVAWLVFLCALAHAAERIAGYLWHVRAARFLLAEERKPVPVDVPPAVVELPIEEPAPEIRDAHQASSSESRNPVEEPPEVVEVVDELDDESITLLTLHSNQ